MRIVLDTNVLLSALIFRKRLGAISELIEKGNITPCFISSTWKEFENVLHYQKLHKTIRLLNITPEEILLSIMPQSFFFSDPKKIPNILNDVADNYILAAAMVAKATYIVSGDIELIKLHTFYDIPIISPNEFLKLF